MTSQKTFFAFQRFGYHVSVEHDEKLKKHPQPKFGGNRFMGAPRYGGMNTYLAPIEISVNWPWFQTVMNPANLH